MRGRKKKIDVAAETQILQVLRMGCSLQDAADLIGVDRSTLTRHKQRRWIFAQGIKRSVVEGKLLHLQRVNSGAKQWQASAWFLERRWPRQFALGGRVQRERMRDSDLFSNIPQMGGIEMPPGAIPPMAPIGIKVQEKTPEKRIKPA